MSVWAHTQPGRYYFYYFVRAVARAVLRIFTRYAVEGLDNVPQDGGVILAPNHTSYADPPIVGSACKRRVWFMAKSELFNIFGLKRVIVLCGAFPVTRGAADRKALRTALSLLERGEVLCVFPEGQRSLDGKLLPAEVGFSFLAAKAQVPVVPVAITGARDFLRPGSPLFRFAKVRVRFGPPLPPPPNTDDKKVLEEIGQQVMASIASLMGVPAPGSAP